MSEIYSDASAITDDENSIIFNRKRGRKSLNGDDDKKIFDTEKKKLARNLFSCENMFSRRVFLVDAIPASIRDKASEERIFNEKVI